MKMDLLQFIGKIGSRLTEKQGWRTMSMGYSKMDDCKKDNRLVFLEDFAEFASQRMTLGDIQQFITDEFGKDE